MKAVALDGFTGAWFQSGTSFCLSPVTVLKCSSSFYLHHHRSHQRHIPSHLNWMTTQWFIPPWILELFQAVFHSSFRNHLPPVSMGSLRLPLARTLSFSTPCLYLPTLYFLISISLPWMKTIKMRTAFQGVLLSSISQVKCLACSRCSSR